MKTYPANEPCPCGSGKKFAQCCRPYLKGSQVAPTAEVLMRSRYTAFALAHSSYLLETLHPSQRQGLTREELDAYHQQMHWIGLKVTATEAGTSEDQQGTVSFIASYIEQGQPGQLKETSRFIHENGRWYYLDGAVQRH